MLWLPNLMFLLLFLRLLNSLLRLSLWLLNSLLRLLSWLLNLRFLNLGLSLLLNLRPLMILLLPLLS